MVVASSSPKTIVQFRASGRFTIKNGSYANNLVIQNNSNISNTSGSDLTLAPGQSVDYIPVDATGLRVTQISLDFSNSVTGILGMGNGGTGWASITTGAIPFGNGSSALATSSSLSFDGTKFVTPFASTSVFSISSNAYFPGSGVWTSSGSVGIGTSNPTGLLHLAQTDYVGNTPVAPIVLSRYWGSSTDTRAAAIYKYLNNTNANDQLVFGVTGNGGSLTDPTLYSNAKMVIQANGNVGIGTTTPQARFDIAGANNGTAPLFQLSSVTNWATTTQFLVTSGGNVGIGTSSPDTLLTVGSNSPSGNVAHFENSTGSCYINPTTTSLSCSSDARLKTNVVPLDSADGLAAVLKLNPVSYNWKTESATSSPHIGFIAQDVQPVLPDLVSQSPDGYYTLNYAGLTPYLVKAIQEIATLSDTFKTTLIAWLADAQNGITDLYASIVHSKETDTQKLCVTDSPTDSSPLCLTKSQLAGLLSQSAAFSLSTSATSSTSPQASNSGNTGNGNSTPPVISINGANPATITVGTTYADLGATITGPQADLNLGLTIVVDNATSTDGTVQIDTSTPGTHTIYTPLLDLPRFRGEVRCWVSVTDVGLRRPPCRCSSLVRPQRSPFLHPGPCAGSAVAHSPCQARADCAPARACA